MASSRQRKEGSTRGHGYINSERHSAMGLHRRDLLRSAGALAAAVVLNDRRSLSQTTDRVMNEPKPVLTPASPAYDNVLNSLHNGAAADQDPALIAQPRCEAEVIEAIQLAHQRGLAISVCSGSHSALCSRSGTLMLDLASGLNRIEPLGDLVTLQGGASMGALLQSLAPTGRMVPVGTHATPGFGLLTMGGIGHLSRSLGLTVDHIVELRGVSAIGEPFVISAKDPDQELWMLLRGGAIFLAVITQATLRTAPRSQLAVVRQVQPLARLSDVLAQAEALPPEGSCSVILGFPPDRQQPHLLSFAVADQPHRELLNAFEKQPGSWNAVVAGLEELPAFDLPGADGSVPLLPPPNGDRHQRLRTRVYSISLPSGLGQALSTMLIEAITRAPNRDCRIDLQHVGGIVNQVAMDQTAYRGRQAEWSIVVTAVWAPSDQTAAANACRWADRCFDALATMANHYYIVQRHPGTPRYARELELAYGPVLEPLRRRQRLMDPQGQLASLG